ncbi:MAG TPA: helix-turn-helix domain-containing protein [Alphaproteobacteria bacterium]|jgi:AraC-like DNA-binding protein
MAMVLAETKLPGRIERPEPGVLVQRLTTDGLAERDQYPYWKEAVCGIFVGLDCSRQARGAFHSAVLRRTFALEGGGSASFIDVVSEAQNALRSPRQIRRATDACIMLAFQTRGPGTLRHGEDVAHLAPGDMVLYDSTRPYEFVFDRPFSQLVLKFPHERLAPRLPRTPNWLGRPVAATSPLGHVLAGHLAAVSSTIDHVDPTLRPGLIDRTMDLIALTFAGAARDFAGAGTTVQAALVARAKRCIETRLADPALAAGEIAAALGVSPGYLHRLFHAAGTTVGSHIRARRLERCRADLADPLHAGERITEIALRWGFNDMPHFSRVFRAAFGQGPRDWRAAARRGLPEDAPLR